MKVVNEHIKIGTSGNGDLKDITPKLRKITELSGLAKGNLTVFVIGSTAGIVTFEYEPGLIKDMQDMYERIAPSDKHYRHDDTWGDANGFSHLRSALQGQSLTIPFENNKLLLGTWQQVVLAEFDNRPRQREVVVQLIGE